MSDREAKKLRRARKAELRRELRGRRAALETRLSLLPPVRRARNRRRIRRLLTVALLALLLLFIRCEEEPAPAQDPGPVATPGLLVPIVPPKQAPAARKDSLDDIHGTRRASYGAQAASTPTWVDDFRMQVAARSPRLAGCFLGVDRPGALRWTAFVNPEGGAVSNHELEPIGATSDLTGRQRDCLIQALSSPAYRVERAQAASDTRSTPSRVSIVIEF